MLHIGIVVAKDIEVVIQSSACLVAGIDQIVRDAFDFQLVMAPVAGSICKDSALVFSAFSVADAEPRYWEAPAKTRNFRDDVGGISAAMKASVPSLSRCEGTSRPFSLRTTSPATLIDAGRITRSVRFQEFVLNTAIAPVAIGGRNLLEGVGLKRLHMLLRIQGKLLLERPLFCDELALRLTPAIVRAPCMLVVKDNILPGVVEAGMRIGRRFSMEYRI